MAQKGLPLWPAIPLPHPYHWGAQTFSLVEQKEIKVLWEAKWLLEMTRKAQLIE